MSFYAHRGIYNNKTIPENTIPAFQEAIRENINIELDIQWTKDQQIVVFHDEDLIRMAGVNRQIKESTYEELKTIKLQNTSFTIPLLKNVLELVDGKCTLLIEIKGKVSKENCDQLSFLLSNYKGKIILQTFYPSVILKIHRSSLHSYPTGILLTNHYHGLKKKFYELYMFYFFIRRKYCSFISSPKELLFHVKKYTKKELFVWTITSEQEIKMFQNEVDHLICDIEKIKTKV